MIAIRFHSPPSVFISIAMYNDKPKKDWLSAVITAAVGAGAVTTFAISQGQHPLMALGITGFAVMAALVVEECFQLLKLK